MVKISRCWTVLGASLGLAAGAGGVRVASAQVDPTPSYSLENAIGTALASNRSLRRAQLELQSAGEQVREAWGSVLPEIDAAVGYTRNLLVQETFLPAIIFDPNAPANELVPVRFGADNNWRAELVIDQPIFDAGAFVGVGAASRFEGLQYERVRGRAQRVTSEVRRAYYAALLARESLRVIQESVDRTEQTLKETQALHLAGLSSSYDVLRLDVRLGNLRPNLRRVTNAMAAAERDLSVVMGLDQVETIQVAGQLYLMDLASIQANDAANRELLSLVGYEDALATSYEQLVDTAYQMRSDLRQARLTRELEDARVKFERTSYYPRLSAFFTYGVFALEDGSLNPFGERSNQRSPFSQLGLLLEIPIFQGFERSARVQQRQLARQQADVLVRQLEQQIENQIQTALEALEEAKLRSESQRQAVSEARRGYEIVNAQYLAGTSSQLEVTDGEVALRESEFNYAEAVFDYLMAQADLDDAVGVVPIVDTPVNAAGDVRVSLKDEQTRKGNTPHDSEDQ